MASKIISRSTRLQFVKEYLDGNAVRDVKKKYGISHDTIYESLKIFGKEPRGGKIRKISWPQRREIARQYRKGIGTWALAKRFNVSVPSISYTLKIMDVLMRPSAFAKRHSLNEHAFDKLNEAALYWLGFFAADGHIGVATAGSQAPVDLHLSRKDIEHVRRFRIFLGATHKIQIRERSARVQIRSNKIATRMIQLGIKPKFGNKIDKQLTKSRHFWRGMIDGDGSLGIYKIETRPHVVSLHLVGPENILLAFIAFARKYVETKKIPSRINRCIKPTFQISFSARMARILIRVLYTQHSISLRRKQIIADRIMREFPSD